MIRSKTKKYMKTISVLIVIGGVISAGSIYLKNRTVEKITDCKDDEEINYEIGVNSNIEIENSIVEGCNLNQYLKGNAKSVSDDNGVYRYDDKSGTTWIYENDKGEVYCIEQVLKYTKDDWNKIKEFWSTLGNSEQLYLGDEEVDLNELDWDNENNEVQLSGCSDLYEYCFNRFENYIDEVEDEAGKTGEKEGFDGTAISIRISLLEEEVSLNE